MPRSAGIYSKPFPDVIEGTTIESAVHNGTISDIEVDLNTPRPIIAGGTGANNAHDALLNLHAEESGQVVTNYDTFPFVNGSFYSSPAATGAPNSINYFAGICYGVDLGLPTLVVHTLTGGSTLGPCYTRTKSGTWGPWTLQSGSAADTDARYVNATGDTMTGALTMQYTDPTILLTKGASGENCTIASRTGGVLRWYMLLGDYGPEGGGNAGSNFDLWGMSDDGATIVANLSLARGTGQLNLTGPDANFTTSGAIVAGATGTVGTYYFGNTYTKFLSCNGGIFNLQGAALSVAAGNLTLQAGNFTSKESGAPVGGSYYFGDGSGGLRALSYNGTDYSLGGDAAFNKLRSQIPLNAMGNSFSPAPANIDFAGLVTSGPFGGGITLQDGAGRSVIWAQSGDMLFATAASSAIATQLLLATNGNHHAYGNWFINNQGYKPGGGSWADSSDARIKNVLGDYESGLDAIVALQPVRFTYKGNDTGDVPSSNKHPTPDDDPSTKQGVVVPYPNSGHYDVAVAAQEYIGLIAQDAEIPMPELVTTREGYIDGVKVTDLRNIDQTPLVFALINAVKELKARIEVLEAAP